MAFKSRARVLDADDISRIVRRISHEILERNKGSGDMTLVGIRTRGVFLARRLAGTIEKIEGGVVEVGELDVSFYRDDIATRGSAAAVGVTQIDFDINDKQVVIVDDVLFTGLLDTSANERAESRSLYISSESSSDIESRCLCPFAPGITPPLRSLPCRPRLSPPAKA